MAPTLIGHRARRDVMLAVLLACAAIALVAPARTARASATSTPSFEGAVLEGEGAGGAELLTLGWALDFAGTSSETELGYIASSEAEGRRAFLDGRSDFFISGLPLSQDHVAELEKGRGVVTVPIQGTGTSILLAGPYPDGVQICRPGLVLDEEAFDIYCPSPIERLSVGSDGSPGESLRLNPEDLADMFLATGNNAWTNDRFRMQAGGEILSGLSSPVGAVRSDGSATNYYFQQYLAAQVPDPWQRAVVSSGNDPATYRIGELWPLFTTPSRAGNATLVGTVRQWMSPASDITPSGGAAVLANPRSAADAIELAGEEAVTLGKARTDLWVTELQNANGDWVWPTGASITAALEAGNGEPLYAMTNRVPGGWPLAWVNTLYAPERGLTVAQTNALAAVIRYQSTIGAQRAESIGDGRLPDALVAEAVAAADRLVESNCAAAKGEVRRDAAPAALVPAGAAEAMASLGDRPWCHAGAESPAPTTTTIAALPLPDGLYDSYGGDAGLDLYDDQFASADAFTDVAAGDISTSVPPDTLATAAADSGTGSDGMDMIAAEMPLGLPGTGARGIDRLATVALGASLYFAVRSLSRSGAFRRLAGLGR